MFWTRFIELCNEAGKSPNAVAAACGVKSSGTVTGWCNGSTPRTPMLHKLADYFNVTPDYLLGNVDLPFLFKDEKDVLGIDLYAATETKKPTPDGGDGLSDTGRKIMEYVGRMSEREQEAFLAWLQASQERS